LAGHAFFLPLSIAGMQIGLAVAAAGVLLSPPRPLRTPLDVPALVFVGIAILSDLLAPSGPPAFAAATLWRAVLGFIVVAHALRIAPPRTPWRLLVCLSVGLLCASVVGLLQYRTGFDLVHGRGPRCATSGSPRAPFDRLLRVSEPGPSLHLVARPGRHPRSSAPRRRIRELPARPRTLLRPCRSAILHADLGTQPRAVHARGNGSAGTRRAFLAADCRRPHGAAEQEPVRAGRAGGAGRLVHHRPGPRRALRHQGHVRAVVLASGSNVARTAAGQSCRMSRSTDMRKIHFSGCGCRR